MLPVPSKVKVRSWALAVGAVVSSMVNVADEVVVFPQSSEAVKVTKAEPVAPQSSLKEVKSWVQVTAPQSSVAVAPPLLLSQAVKAALFPAPSDSTVSSAA